MNKLTYTIRYYRPQDFDTLVQLEGEVHMLAPIRCLISPLDLMESATQPNPPPQSTLFVAERAGEIIGYADLKSESNIGRAVLRWLVNPKHHKRDLITKLVDRAISRAGELGVMIVHVNIPQDSQRVEHLLVKMGFTFVRRFLELRLDFSKTDLLESSKSPLRCRFMQPGEEARLTDLQNRSFTGSWGYNPNTVEEIRVRVNLPNCSPRDIILAFDSDKPIGYCWTRINFWDNTPDQGTGRIYMMGVDPDYRGRGLGRQLLLAGLSYLKSKDLRRVELTVDSENKEACTLYKSVGFKLWTSSLWYEKRLE
jgi:mycothiol synthase